LESVQFDQSLGKDRSFAKSTQGASFEVFEDEIDFMVLDDGIEVLDYIPVVEVLNESYFLLDRLYLLLADRHLLHRDDAASRQVDPLVDQTVRTLADCLNYLVRLDYARF